MRSERLSSARTGRWRWPRLAVAAGTVLIVGSLTVLVPAWIASRATVHPVTSGRPEQLALRAGAYRVYQDPGSVAFALPPHAVTVTGPGGPVRVRAVSWALEPSAVAAPILGIGMFAPVAGFTISQAGRYQLTVSRAAGGVKVFVGEPLSTAFRAAGPPAAGLVAGAILLFAGWKLPRRRGRLRYERPTAPPVPACDPS